MSIKPTRRGREIPRIREDILSAAARACGGRDFSTVTMQQIATAAGYTPPTLYSYFQSKDEIHEAVLDLVHRDLRRAFEAELPASLTFEQRLELLMLRMAEVAEARQEAYGFFLSSRGAPRVAQGVERYVALMTAWFEQHAPPALLADFSAEDLATCLVGMGDQHFQRWLQARPRAPFSRRMQVVLRIFLHGIRRPK